jgi:hypothetical protein
MVLYNHSSITSIGSVDETSYCTCSISYELNADSVQLDADKNRCFETWVVCWTRESVPYMYAFDIDIDIVTSTRYMQVKYAW